MQKFYSSKFFIFCFIKNQKYYFSVCFKQIYSSITGCMQSFRLRINRDFKHFKKIILQDTNVPNEKEKLF